MKTAQDNSIDSQPNQAQQLVNTQLLPDFRKALSEQAKTWHRATQAYLKSYQCSEKSAEQNKNDPERNQCHPPNNRELLASSGKSVS